jgi:7,8-dihydroneopterin aldolase/epimerase/oxygenase
MISSALSPSWIHFCVPRNVPRSAEEPLLDWRPIDAASPHVETDLKWSDPSIAFDPHDSLMESIATMTTGEPGTIFLNGLQVMSDIGADESAVRHQLSIDLRVQLDLNLAACSDELSDSVNYADLAREIASVLTATRHRCFASAAHTVAARLLHAEPKLHEVSLILRSSRASLSGMVGEAGASVTRRRS